MKATFFERLGSYVLDIIIVLVLLGIVGMGFEESAADKKLEAITNQFAAQEITAEEYLNEYSELSYDAQKENILEVGITVALITAYFAIFQYMNNGQTLGKKLIGIKVVDKNTEKPTTIIKGIIRTLFISFYVSGVATGIINIVLLYTLNKNNYMSVYSIVSTVELIFTVTTAMLVLYRKDRRGLHDMITNTIVIKERRKNNA
jgi:uncharacterized RDD family membrane protein YckC